VVVIGYIMRVPVQRPEQVSQETVAVPMVCGVIDLAVLRAE